MASKLTKRSENYAKWYQELVTGADLAENSPVRGCMVIKPYGYAIWEKVQAELDRQFKATGHQNAYFPLFIPKSYFTREASHVDGFAKECAVVTHYRLKEGPEGEGIVVDENARLEEELIVRPTSETVIWDTFKGWIQSYRDLPLKINQWANVVRWEMRTRLFLRTAEFLWQEGHTAHTTREEAVEEAELMLKLYGDFVEQYMAIPVVRGVKTASERFAGAVETYCIEALMQDGKALQAGTTHFLGQNFAKAFDVTYASKEGQQEYVWATSWGVSTRLMGALVMTHSDDNGLVLPPYLAPHQVVIVPIYRSAEQLEAVRAAIAPLKEELEKAGIRVHLDDRDTHKPGWKFAEYELKGVPIRLAMGPRDLENGTVELARRDELSKEVVPVAGIAERVEKLLAEIQDRLYQRAAQRQKEKTHQADDWVTFKELIASSAGFVSAHWDGTAETEEAIKNETKATIRCIPLDQKEEPGSCVYSGKPSQGRVLFAKAY
ncbi:MAG: proline--tRNA ligase [Schleiferiaceae bacterium]|nr:proline--tRNA ligase [Schleiferiaceae bacterium]MDR9442121.1 proline--tRNA ligase [Schleiferiaceae bacterium]